MTNIILLVIQLVVLVVMIVMILTINNGIKRLKKTPHEQMKGEGETMMKKYLWRKGDRR